MVKYHAEFARYIVLVYILVGGVQTYTMIIATFVEFRQQYQGSVEAINNVKMRIGDSTSSIDSSPSTVCLMDPSQMRTVNEDLPELVHHPGPSQQKKEHEVLS